VQKALVINGLPITEPYAVFRTESIDDFRDNFPTEPPPTLPNPEWKEWLKRNIDGHEIVVPDDKFFVLGDNRDNSLDSRYWGFVPRENIIGKPLLIFWSYDAPTADLVGYSADHFLDLAKNFFFKTRWDRELKLVRGWPVE